MGYVRKRTDDGRGYQARWYDPTFLDKNGEPKQRSKTFRTSKEAKAWLTKIDSTTPEQRSKEKEAEERSNATFATYAEEWFKTKAAKKRKTLAGYRMILDKHVLPAFGSLPVGSIDAGMIDLFTARLTVAPATQRNILRVLGMALGHALKRRAIPTNPMVEADKPKVRRTEMRTLSASQVHDLAEAIDPTYRTYVTVAAGTGMRAGELVGLRVRDINFLRREIQVSTSVSDVNGVLRDEGTPKSEASRRAVPIGARLAEMLSVQVAGKDRDNLVFPSPVGGGYLRHGNFMARNWRPTVARLIADPEYPTWTEDLSGVRFHDLRHTYATLAIQAGINVKVVSSILGHANISITMDTYTHVIDAQRDEAGATMDAVFNVDTGPVSTGEVVSLG